MGEQVERIIIRTEFEDDASQGVQRLRGRAASLGKEIDKLRSQTDQFNRQQKISNRELERTSRFAKQLAGDRNKEVSSLKLLKAEIKAVSDARRKGLSEARLVGQVGRGAQQIGGALGGVAGPQVGQLAGIGPEILGVVENLGVLKAQLPELAQNLGITKQSAALLAVEAIVLTAAFVIIKDLTEDIVAGAKAAQEAVTGQIDALRQFNKFIADATSEEARTRLDEVVARREINAQLQSDLLELRNLVEAGVDISDEGILEALSEGAVRAADRFGIMEVGLKDIDEALSETRTEIQSTDKEFGLLVESLTDGSLAARDLAARERENTQAKIEGLQRESRILQESQTLTQKQLDEKLQAIEDERLAQQSLLDDLVALGSTSDLVGDEIEATENRLSELSEEMRLLTEIATPLVALREREAATLKLVETNIKLTRTAYESAIKSQAKFTDELAEFEAKRLQAEEEFAEKTIEINEKRHLSIIQDDEKAALKRVNDLADHYKDLAEIDQDFFEDRADLLATIGDDLNDLDDEKLVALKEFNKTEIRATVDHLKRLNDIRLRAQNSIRSASARLDALGIFEAKQAAEAELKNENEKFNEEKKRRAEDFRDLQQQLTKERQETLRASKQALRDLERKHQRERQSTIAAFNEKVRREDQQFALERRQQQQRWALEDRQRQEQFDNEAEAQAKHFSLLLTLTVNGLFQTELAYQAWLDSVAARTANTLQTGTTAPVGAPPVPPPQTPTQFAPLANTITNGPQAAVNFRQPTAAPMMAGDAAMAGASIIINIDGSRQPMQVGAEVRRELENVFGSIATR